MEPHRLQHVLDVIPRRVRSNQKFNRPSFIYLIRCGEFVKVGIADRPVKRMGEMQVGNPYPLRLLHAWRTSNAISAERWLHAELINQHHAGEWFRMTGDEARALIAQLPDLDAAVPTGPTVN